MSGRYRVSTVLAAAFVAGVIVSWLPGWCGLVFGAVAGWFSANIARWISAARQV